jgi:MFS family permease
MITQAWRSLVMAALALAVLTDLVQVWQLFVVAFVITVGEILVDPSVVATVPTIVEPSNLDRANSRITMVETVTNEFVGGPVGAATFTFVPWLPFVLDSLSYLGSIAPFSRLPTTQAMPVVEETKRSIRTEMGEGLRWIKGHAFLRPLTLGIAVFHLGTAGAISLLVILVVDVLEAPAIVFGFVLSAAAVGATLSSLMAASLVDRFSRRAVITLAATVTGLSVIASGLVSNEWQLIVAWVFNGLGGGLSLSIGRGFIQRHTPSDLLGRTAIASRMLTRPSFVIGSLLAGIIATYTSVRWSFVVAGLFHLLGALLLWRSFEHESD